MRRLILPVCLISGLFAAANPQYQIINIYKVPLKSLLKYNRGEITLSQLKNTGKKITYSEYKKETEHSYIVRKKVNEVLFLKNPARYNNTQVHQVIPDKVAPKTPLVSRKTKKSGIDYGTLSLATLIRYAVYNYDKLTVKDKNEIIKWILIKVKEDKRLDYLAIYSYLKVHGLTKPFLKELLQTVIFLSKQGLL